MERRLVVLFVIALSSCFASAAGRFRTIKSFRSIKDSNISRLNRERRLDDFSLGNNPLIYAPEPQEPGSGAENNHHFMMLSYEIQKRNLDVKRLSDFVVGVQKKVDDLSESVIDRINEINNLVNTQLLGHEGI